MGKTNSRRTAFGGPLLGLVVLVTAGCDVGSSGDGNETATASLPNVEAVKILPHRVTYLEARRQVDAVGTARARQEAVIYPKTGGEVTDVRFVAGDRVGAGDVLLKLDDQEERLAVRRAEVQVRDAEQLLARYQRIDVPGAISESQVDEAQTALDAARIDLGLARVALEERTVRAPFAGHVGLTDIDPGTRITPQTEITRLDDRAVLFVDFDAPEQVFDQLAPGDRVPMSPFARPDTTLEAEILTVNSRIEAQSRSVRVRAPIDNEEDRLRPGMSFRVRFEVPGEVYPAVPEAAIVWGGDGAYVWAVRDGKATRVAVTIVARREGLVLVRASLDPGETIVGEGVQKVREGRAVSIPSDDKTGDGGLSAAIGSGTAASGALRP